MKRIIKYFGCLITSMCLVFSMNCFSVFANSEKTIGIEPLLEESDVYVEYRGIEEYSSDAWILNMYVENNRDTEICLELDDVLINGYVINGYVINLSNNGINSITGNSKYLAELNFGYIIAVETLSEYGIDKITDIDFNLRIKEEWAGDAIYETPVSLEIEKDVPTKDKKCVIEEGTKVLDKDIKISYCGFSLYSNSPYIRNTYILNTYVENTTSNEIYIDVDNLLINGFSVKIANTNMSIPANSKFLASPHFAFVVNQEDLDAYGISDIETISFTYTIKNDWIGDTIYDIPVSIKGDVVESPTAITADSASETQNTQAVDQETQDVSVVENQETESVATTEEGNASLTATNSSDTGYVEYSFDCVKLEAPSSWIPEQGLGDQILFGISGEKVKECVDIVGFEVNNHIPSQELAYDYMENYLIPSLQSSIGYNITSKEIYRDSNVPAYHLNYSYSDSGTELYCFIDSYLFLASEKYILQINYWYYDELDLDYAEGFDHLIKSVTIPNYEYTPLDKPATASGSSDFTNAYGTPTTKCAHSGCNNYIASSGDTNCCTTHSNKCQICGKYIDEDAMYCMSCLSGSSSSKSSSSGSSDFTNAYGTPTTKCAHSGCNNYIASSGDTNCCTTHSNKCQKCGKYIDEDAMYCMSCLSGSSSSKSSSSGSSSNSSSGFNSSSGTAGGSAKAQYKDGKIYYIP